MSAGDPASGRRGVPLAGTARDAGVRAEAAGIEVTARGRVLRFPAAWLRDNCPCASCRDPVTGQRLLDLASLPDQAARRRAGRTPPRSP